MFVGPGVNLPTNIQSALEEFCNENRVEDTPRPLRVLFARFRVLTPGPWTSDEASACGVTPDFAQEHGLTLVVWGSTSPNTGREWESLPGEFFVDNLARNLEVRDTIVPTGVRNAIPYHIGSDDAPDVGEILERTVWLFGHIGYYPDPELLDLDKVIMEPLRRSMNPGIFEEFMAEREELSAAAYAEVMAANPERRVSLQRDNIDANTQQLRSYESQIITLRNNLDTQRRELDAIMNSMNVPADHWKDEWKKITRHPMIVPGSLTMIDRTVQYDTVALDITDGNVTVPLGRMRITIDMESAGVTIQNLNNRRRNRDHPHVESGSPCWGGYHSELIDHMRNHRLAGVVEFIFGYLQTCNPDDEWGRYFRYWADSPELLEV